jgi:hypothetical protein
MHDIAIIRITSYNIRKYFTEGVGIQTFIQAFYGIVDFTFGGRNTSTIITGTHCANVYISRQKKAKKTKGFLDAKKPLIFFKGTLIS